MGSELFHAGIMSALETLAGLSGVARDEGEEKGSCLHAVRNDRSEGEMPGRTCSAIIAGQPYIAGVSGLAGWLEPSVRTGGKL